MCEFGPPPRVSRSEFCIIYFRKLYSYIKRNNFQTYIFKICWKMERYDRLKCTKLLEKNYSLIDNQLSHMMEKDRIQDRMRDSICLLNKRSEILYLLGQEEVQFGHETACTCWTTGRRASAWCKWVRTICTCWPGGLTACMYLPDKRADRLYLLDRRADR